MFGSPVSCRAPLLLGLLACGTPVPGAAVLQASAVTVSTPRVAVAAEGNTIWSVDADGGVHKGTLAGGDAVASLPAAPRDVAVVGATLVACVPGHGVYGVSAGGVERLVAHLPTDGEPQTVDVARQGGAGTRAVDACVAVALSTDGARVYFAEPDALWLMDRAVGTLSRLPATLGNIGGIAVDLHPGMLREQQLIVAHGTTLAAVSVAEGTADARSETPRALSSLTRDPQGRLWAVAPPQSQWWTPVAKAFDLADETLVAVYDWRAEQELALRTTSGTTSVAVAGDQLWLVGDKAQRADIAPVLGL